ncbi:MAG TPA: hypothetical protein VFK41_01315 [Nocardioidaceae bacterium]|nr:hypothetical protein [Nocardioidaceae bacterium]
MRSRYGIPIALALLALTGCGLEGADKDVANLLADALPAEYTGLTAEEATCVAEHWVEEIGRPALKKGGLLGEQDTLVGNVREVELSEDDAAEAYAGFDDCTDVRALVSGMVTSLFEADEQQSACIDDKVTGDAVERWIVADLQGDPVDNVYVVAGRDCMSTAAADARAVNAISGGLGKREGMTPEQARCVGEQMVERIGVYELTAAGVLDEQQQLVEGMQGVELNETDANLAADATQACVSMEDMLSATLAGGGESGAGAEVKACFGAAFDDERFHAYLVQAYMGRAGTGLDEETTQELADCLRAVLEEKQEQD